MTTPYVKTIPLDQRKLGNALRLYNVRATLAHFQRLLDDLEIERLALEVEEQRSEKPTLQFFKALRVADASERLLADELIARRLA